MPAYNKRMSRVSEPLNLQSMIMHTAEGFPWYLDHGILIICSRAQQKDFQSIWAIRFSENDLPYNKRMSRVSDPLNCESMFLHTAEGFPKYLSHWILKVCPCRQEKHLPHIWAIKFSKYIPAYSRKISRVSEPLNFHNTFLHITEGFPEYLSHWIFEMNSCIWEKDFPSIWATEPSKYVLAYNRRISRVSEPLNSQSMSLQTREASPAYLSH